MKSSGQLGRIVSLHVCDWLMDTTDLRLDRGMMGDGVIDIRRIRRLVEETGYNGYREVEIFSERNWWRRDPDEVVAHCQGPLSVGRDLTPGVGEAKTE